jgi:hypothetical protein
MDIQTIYDELQMIHTKVDRIEHLIESYIKPSCSEMSAHIHFIKQVYDTIKTPLHYVSDRIQKYIGRNDRVIAFSTTDVIDYFPLNVDKTS